MALVKVRYKGLSDMRSMSVQELAAHGVGVSADLVWEGLKPVLLRDPSEELLDILRREGTFTVTEVDDETGLEGQTIIEGAALDDTGVSVIDGNTGQVSTVPGADPTATSADGQKAKDKTKQQ